MNHRRSIVAIVFVIGLIATFKISVSAQADPKNQTDASYEIELQVLIGANEAGARNEIPKDLAGISRQIKAKFEFVGYRVANTFLGRVANNGSFEYKSVSNVFGKEPTGSPQTFLEWGVARFRVAPMVSGVQGIQAEAFRFGMRVPILIGGTKDTSGSANPSIVYEQVGLSVGRIGLAQNIPTLIGTLNLPDTNGTIFLVMTVKPVEM